MSTINLYSPNIKQEKIANVLPIHLSEYILQPLAVTSTKDGVIAHMDYSGNKLSEYIHNADTTEKFNVLDQLVRIVSELHLNNILFSDIGIDSFVVKDNIIYLRDTSSCFVWFEDEKRIDIKDIDNIIYLAPETLEKGIVNPQTNIWTLGMMALYIYSGNITRKRFLSLKTRSFSVTVKNMKLFHNEIDRDMVYQQEMKNIISLMLSFDGMKRPVLGEGLKIKNFDHELASFLPLDLLYLASKIDFIDENIDENISFLVSVVCAERLMKITALTDEILLELGFEHGWLQQLETLANDLYVVRDAVLF